MHKPIKQNAALCCSLESRKLEQKAVLLSSRRPTNQGGERRAIEKRVPEPKLEEEPRKVLEFYSGIGGMLWGTCMASFPPCQPYTRQGLQKQSGDARAISFLKILKLIPLLSQPPNMLFVENVVSFEISDTHSRLIEVLVKADFVTQEFVLNPLQFDVPYSRPRYFCLVPLSLWFLPFTKLGKFEAPSFYHNFNL